MAVERTCPVCRLAFVVDKPSRKQRCCGHRCAWKEFGSRVHAASQTPAARAKRADSRRGTGRGDGYIKRGGRHEHRLVMESTLGRPLVAGELVHHLDENKRNNAPENLAVVDAAEHARIHFTGKPRPSISHCKRGHEFTEANTRIGSQGERRCIQCARDYDREWKRARRLSISQQGAKG